MALIKKVELASHQALFVCLRNPLLSVILFRGLNYATSYLPRVAAMVMIKKNDPYDILMKDTFMERANK